MTHDGKPALLTKDEIEWLSGRSNPSNVYARNMRSRIKKLDVFKMLEVPLLSEAGFDVSAGSYNVTAGCHNMQHNQAGPFGPGSSNPDIMHENDASGAGVA